MADQNLDISRPNLYQPLFQGLQEVGHLSVLLDAADHRSVDVVKVGIRRFPCRHFTWHDTEVALALLNRRSQVPVSAVA